MILTILLLVIDLNFIFTILFHREDTPIVRFLSNYRGVALNNLHVSAYST